jgi:hypothetical protein
VTDHSQAATPEIAGSFERNALVSEARRIERRASIWSSVHRREARMWRRLNTLLVCIAALLAAVSGGTGLTAVLGRDWVAMLALLAAAASAVTAALGASQRASASMNGAIADMTLADSARRYYLTIAPHVSIQEARSHFDRLCEHRDRVVAASPGDTDPWFHRSYSRIRAHVLESMDRTRAEMERAERIISADPDAVGPANSDRDL